MAAKWQKKNCFLIFALLLTIASAASAQSRIDKYCQVLVGNDNSTLYIKIPISRQAT